MAMFFSLDSADRDRQVSASSLQPQRLCVPINTQAYAVLQEPRAATAAEANRLV
jgi:hypothetical protein